MRKTICYIMNRDASCYSLWVIGKILILISTIPEEQRKLSVLRMSVLLKTYGFEL